MGLKKFVISVEDERALIQRAQAGDQRAAAALIEQFTPIILGYVRKRSGYGVDVEDLKQEGRMGLYRAIMGFDLAKFESRLSTYATWWVRANIDEYVRKNWCDINFKGGADRAHLWREFLATVGRPTSIDAPDSDGLTFTLRDDVPLADEALAEKQQRAAGLAIIRKRMASLNAQQKQVINGRWLTDDAQTLDELSQKMGVTKQRIDQVEKRALAILGVSQLRRKKLRGVHRRESVC